MKKSLLFLGAALLLTATGLSRAQGINQNQKLRMAEAAISQFYVDTVNEAKLVEDAIRGMLEGLDPHSQYSNPEETRELNEPLTGNF
ncbi:MAG: peptidase S41, partial [Muribaculaceae bacterium]|nr:peptidase S41 [Muribaculaceae bacterium]